MGLPLNFNNTAFVLGLCIVTLTGGPPKFEIVNIEKNAQELITLPCIPYFYTFIWNPAIPPRSAGLPKRFYTLTFRLALNEILKDERKKFENCKVKNIPCMA